MNRQAILEILPVHVDGARDIMIFGHFLERFHRQIYGGVYDPGSHLADANGFRRDVIAALRHIRTPVIRWPGACGAADSPTARSGRFGCRRIWRTGATTYSACYTARVIRSA